MSRSQQSIVTLGALGCVLLGLTRLGLVLQRHDNLPGFIVTALVQGIVYLAAVWIVCRIESKRSVLVAILVIAGLLRVSVVFSPPFLSDDIYRYIWDGRVQAAGINPYRFVPADKQLASLRDESIYSHINRRDYAHTIYPPLAQAIFLGVTRISETVTGMKMAMVGFEAIAIWLIIRLLTAWRLPPERVLIYAWHPLAIWEIAGSGHVEAVLVALIALALWSRSRDTAGAHRSCARRRRVDQTFPCAAASCFLSPMGLEDAPGLCRHVRAGVLAVCERRIRRDRFSSRLLAGGRVSARLGNFPAEPCGPPVWFAGSFGKGLPDFRGGRVWRFLRCT